jgi:hypothetical protein
VDSTLGITPDPLYLANYSRQTYLYTRTAVHIYAQYITDSSPIIRITKYVLSDLCTVRTPFISLVYVSICYYTLHAKHVIHTQISEHMHAEYVKHVQFLWQCTQRTLCQNTYTHHIISIFIYTEELLIINSLQQWKPLSNRLLLWNQIDCYTCKITSK